MTEVFDALLFYEKEIIEPDLISKVDKMRKDDYDTYCLYIYENLDLNRILLYEEDYIYYKNENLGYESGWSRLYPMFLRLIEIPIVKQKIRNNGLNYLLNG